MLTVNFKGCVGTQYQFIITLMYDLRFPLYKIEFDLELMQCGEFSGQFLIKFYNFYQKQFFKSKNNNKYLEKAFKHLSYQIQKLDKTSNYCNEK